VPLGVSRGSWLLESGRSPPTNADVPVSNPRLDLVWKVLALAAGGRFQLSLALGLVHLAVKLDVRLRLLPKAQLLRLNACTDLNIGVLDAIWVALPRHS